MRAGTKRGIIWGVEQTKLISYKPLVSLSIFRSSSRLHTYDLVSFVYEVPNASMPSCRD